MWFRNMSFQQHFSSNDFRFPDKNKYTSSITTKEWYFSIAKIHTHTQAHTAHTCKPPSTTTRPLYVPQVDQNTRCYFIPHTPAVFSFLCLFPVDHCYSHTTKWCEIKNAPSIHTYIYMHAHAKHITSTQLLPTVNELKD